MGLYDTEVQEGARLLDANVPGWHEMIDLEQLEMSNCTRCIIGQVMLTTHAHEVSKVYYDYAVYERGISLLGLIDEPARDGAENSDEEYGFNIYPVDDKGRWIEPSSEQWRALGAAWKREILARRSA